LRGAIASGQGARVFERMIEAQGGDPRVVEDPSILKVAPIEVVIAAERPGFVTGIDALAVGLAAVAMGAGRTRADAKVDPSVGISIVAKPGTEVRSGDVLARLHVHRAEDAAVIEARVRGAFAVSAGPKPPVQPLVRGRLGA
jgi:pyrimidine-nucleoside phosphorylase